MFTNFVVDIYPVQILVVLLVLGTAANFTVGYFRNKKQEAKQSTGVKKLHRAA